MPHKLSGACLLAALLGGAAAHADDSGFYLGAGFGEATQSSAIFDGSDSTFRLLTGYSFSENLAVEGGFVDGGKQEDTLSGLELRIGEHFQLRADYEKVDVPDAAFDVYTLIGAWKF